MKTTLARLAVALLMITFVVGTAHAQIRGKGDFKEGNIWYHIDDDQSVSVDFNGAVFYQNVTHACYDGDVIIPETVEHNGKTYTVIGINQLAFYFCPISSVTLPNTIKTIGLAAFAGCPITELTLPTSLEAFGESVFGGSKIKSITIPSGVKELPSYLFKQSELTEINLPSTLEKMGTEVFRQTKITRINIPDGVETIPERAFMQTPLANIDLPTTLKRIDDGAFQETQLTNIMLPANVDSIGNYAFCLSKLTQVTLPNTVSFLGENAFRECSDLIYINMNCPRLKEIGKYTFYQCKSLNQMTTIPDNVQNIGEYAFYGCTDLQMITFNDVSQLKTIGKNVFTNSALYSVSIPPTVETIDEHAFFDCKALEHVTYAANSQLKDIGNEAFKNCSALKAAIIPNSTEAIGTGAFENCTSLLEVSFPQNVETMETSTFKNCTSLQTITFSTPSRLKRIKNEAMSQCSSLESLVFPEGLEEIGDISYYPSSTVRVYSGSNNPKLTYVYIPSTVKFIKGYAFDKGGTPNANTKNIIFDLESPVDSVGICSFIFAERINIKHYDQWMRLICKSQPFGNVGGQIPHIYNQDTLVTHYIIPEGITSIRDYCFANYKDLCSVVLPNSLKTIGESSFAYCSALQSVTFGDSIKSFERYAFNGCAIQKVHITNSDSWIRMMCNRPSDFRWDYFPNVLLNGEPYVDYVFPDDISNICTDAFYGNKQMQSVTLPKALKTIGQSAFSKCSALRNVSFTTPPESIGPNAFKGCTLQSVDIGDIAKWCAVDFQYESGPFLYTESPKIIVGGVIIDKLVIPSTVTSIANYAFYGCQHFDQVSIPNSVTSIGDYAFYGCSDLATLKFGKRPQLTSIGAYAFQGTSFSSLQLPSSVQTIGSSAFKACSGLTEVSLTDGLKTIGSYSFQNCTALKSVTMPLTLETMNSRVFEGCTALEKIHILDIAAWCKVKISGEWHYNGNIYIEGQPVTELVIPEGVDTICNYTFFYMKGLKKITFPHSLRVIRERCFSFCDKIDSIAIPEGVKSIGYRCFEGCNGIKYISLPSSLQGLATNAFFVPNVQNHNLELHVRDLAGFINASKEANSFLFRASQGYEARLYVNGEQVRDLVVPEGTIQMKNIFKSFNFNTVTLPSSLETILGDAFQYCANLKYVYSRSRFAPTGTNGLMIGASWSDNKSLQAIYVPKGSVNNYKAKWNNSANFIFEAPENINPTGSLSIASLTDSLNAHNHVYDDVVPYLNLTEATLDETVTAESLQNIADKGTIIFLPDGTQDIEGTNIVANSRTPRLILRDSTDFVAPYDFVAEELEYQRNFTASNTEATTLCLPYSLSELPQGMKAYALKCLDTDGNAVFEEVETVEANMPYVVTTTKNINSLQGENVVVKATPTVMPDAGCDEFEFRGALTKVSHDDAAYEEAYVLSNGKQWQSVYDASEDVYVPAGRAYLVPMDIAPISFGTVLQTTSPNVYAIGDVNGDNVVDALDASLILQYVAHKFGDENTDFIKAAADTNNDNVIDALDASLVLQHAAKKIDLNKINNTTE